MLVKENNLNHFLVSRIYKAVELERHSTPARVSLTRDRWLVSPRKQKTYIMRNDFFKHELALLNSNGSHTIGSSNWNYLFRDKIAKWNVTIPQRLINRIIQKTSSQRLFTNSFLSTKVIKDWEKIFSLPLIQCEAKDEKTWNRFSLIARVRV